MSDIQKQKEALSLCSLVVNYLIVGPFCIWKIGCISHELLELISCLLIIISTREGLGQSNWKNIPSRSPPESAQEEAEQNAGILCNFRFSYRNLTQLSACLFLNGLFCYRTRYGLKKLILSNVSEIQRIRFLSWHIEEIESITLQIYLRFM